MHSVTAGARLVASNPVQEIADFVRGFSIEATRPTTDEIAVLSAIAPKGTRVYVSAVPTRPFQEVLDSAIRLKAAGFSPVPHIAARVFTSAAALDRGRAALARATAYERSRVREAGRARPPGD